LELVSYPLMFRVHFRRAGELLSETNSFADDAFDALSMAILNEPRWEETTKIEIERQCNGTSLLQICDQPDG
jgi:hypothetical protein